MKYLGIDFGIKKIGLAYSDDNGILAFPFLILKNKKEIEKEIISILIEKKIENIVIGESVNQKGNLNDISKYIKEFVLNLERELEKNKINCNILFEKEWFSTIEARRYNNKKDIDHSAAAIILQRYLDKKNNDR